MIKYFTSVFILLLTLSIQAQVGIGTVTPDASAILDVEATDKGMLVPRVDIADLTTAAPVTTPATSLLVYNTNTITGEGFYYWNGTKWVSISNGGAIDDLTDGISDNVNNVFLGENTGVNIVPGSGTFGEGGKYNVAIGIDALKTATTVSKSVAIGYRALENNTVGVRNTAIGFLTLQKNTIGSGNVAIGPGTLDKLIASSVNVAVGQFSLNAMTVGTENAAFGASALTNMERGNKNIAIGYDAGKTAQSGDSNIFIGNSVILSDTLVSNQMNIANLIYGANVYNANGNIGIGNGNPIPNASAVLDVTSTTAGLLMPRMTMAQRDVIATPATSLMIYQTDNTPGYYYYDGTSWVSLSGAKSINDLTDGKTNSGPDISVYLGNLAGLSATGNANVGVGNGSLFQASGENNTAFGSASGSAVTTGINNVFLGKTTGGSVTTGSSNILIGADVDPTTITSSNELNIGNTIYGTGIDGVNANVGIGYGNNAPNSTLTVGGSMSLPINSGTVDYTLTDTDYTYITRSSTTDGAEVTLPSAVGRTGRIYIIKNAGSADQTINAQSGENIEGNTSINLFSGSFVHVQCDGVEWFVIGQ